MKKIIALTLCLVLAFSLCVPACASYTADDLIKYLRKLDNDFDYYEVELDDGIICMYIGIDGMCVNAMKAKEDGDFDDWEENVTDLIDELSETLQEQADECDGKPMSCVILVNDRNTDNVLYVSYSGICIYDYVTGYDIAEDDDAA